MKSSRRIKVAMFWLVLMVSLIGLGYGLATWRNIGRSPFRQIDQYFVVVTDNTNKVGLIAIDGNRKSELCLMPDDLEIETIDGYGKYRLVNVFRLGELSGDGVRLISETLLKNYYLPVMAVFVSQKPIVGPGGSIGMINKKGNRPSGVWYLKTGETIKSLPERMKNRLFNLPVIRCPDITNLPVINRTIQAENMAVEIQNLSNVNGLAERTVSLLQANGFRVIRTYGEGSDNNNLDCAIGVKNNYVVSKTVKWLEYFLGCEADYVTSNDRADITIRLGSLYKH